MSEYMEQHEYSKMIGSPPGYLGYGEEGHLTGAVAKLGHCVILFDEVEKAHPNCLRLFLQLFDEGVLTDGKGKRVDFSQCVIVMTSNLGRELWADENQQLGFAKAVSPGEPSAKRVLDYLLKTLPSEFVNRIDDLVPFRNFLRDDLLRIARKMMKEEEERWDRRGKRIAYGERGARAARRHRLERAARRAPSVAQSRAAGVAADVGGGVPGLVARHPEDRDARVGTDGGDGVHAAAVGAASRGLSQRSASAATSAQPSSRPATKALAMARQPTDERCGGSVKSTA